MRGRCLCGAIRFEIEGQLGPIDHCHCSQCRRGSGSAFATNAPVTEEQLTFTAGRELIKEFAATEHKYRAFCSECGSPIYSRRVFKPGQYRIRLGLIDGDVNGGRRAHIWAAHKAPWYEITDGFHQFAEEADW